MAHLFDTSDRSSARPLPRGTSTLAMWWFLGTLSMLFVAGMVGYVLIRLQRASPVIPNPSNAPATHPLPIPLGTLRPDLPALLWVSTFVVIAGSIAIHLAVKSVQREKQARLRFWTRVTLVIGILFCVLQAPAMAAMLRDHTRLLNQAVASGQTVNALYGLIFVLVLLHALHVLGGVIYLAVIERGARLGRYDHEAHAPVTHAALYWHFLDAVWILMFATLYIAG